MLLVFSTLVYYWKYTAPVYLKKHITDKENILLCKVKETIKLLISSVK